MKDNKYAQAAIEALKYFCEENKEENSVFLVAGDNDGLIVLTMGKPKNLVVTVASALKEKTVSEVLSEAALLDMFRNTKTGDDHGM